MLGFRAVGLAVTEKQFTGGEFRVVVPTLLDYTAQIAALR